MREGAILRLRPIMMTALVAALGLVPAALATGVGTDSQRPFALVIVADCSRDCDQRLPHAGALCAGARDRAIGWRCDSSGRPAVAISRLRGKLRRLFRRDHAASAPTSVRTGSS